ncbi:MAG: 50S ribosomal protein L29 [Candidatus Hydrogenedentota bacterium]
MAKAEQIKTSDLRAKTRKELEIMRDDKSQELMNLRFQRAVARLEKPHRIAQLRRERARVLTVLQEKPKEKTK